MNRVTYPLRLRSRGPKVADLQEALLYLIQERRDLFRFPAPVTHTPSPINWDDLLTQLRRERQKRYYGKVTAALVAALQKGLDIKPTGRVDRETADAINRLIFGGTAPIVVRGRVLFEDGRPAAGLTLRFYRFLFGGRTLRVGETETDGRGFYRTELEGDRETLVIEIRAVGPSGREIPLTEPIHGLEGDEVEINLIAPSELSPLKPEYTRLAEDLKPIVGDLKKLVEAEESEKRRDLSVLSTSTGWDARLIALMSTAQRLSRELGGKLPAEGFYALLRAGFPGKKELLLLLSPDKVEETLRKMHDAGIVGLTDQQIVRFRKSFSAQAEKLRPDLPVPGSSTTYGEFLRISGLSAEKQRRFLSLLMEGKDEKLWERAREAGFKEEEIGRLRLQGKLALLTGKSAPLTARLMEMVQDPEELVDRDFDRPETWEGLLLEMVESGESIESLIPPAYGEGETEDRVRAYARDLARMVRLSYPTRTVARMISRSGDLFGFGEIGNVLADVLSEMSRRGYRIGQTPLGSFLRENTDLLNGNGEDVRKLLGDLHRTFKLAPTEEAVPVLFRMNLTSAQEIALYSEEEFTEGFVRAYREIYGRDPDAMEAKLLYRKAQQTEATTLQLIATARLFGNLPSLHVIPADGIRERVKSLPNLETLLGSLDFCECEHCRSVLSPAAYLVDLLRTLEEWGRDRSGGNPYEVLTNRRPDIIRIPLTCENTHTTMPYIDLVNEILEYWIAKNVSNDSDEDSGSDESAVWDTGLAASEELIAEPQYVEPKAYRQMQRARYPLNLPFDLWTETVREFCDLLEIPLWKILKVFGAAEFAILMEQLGLSPAEVSLFTDPDLSDRWYELYGYSSQSEALSKLRSAKDLSRRLGVSYGELAEIVGTEFINLKLAYSAENPCNFAEAELRRGDEPAQPADFLKLNIFVRLRRRLGWSTKELDRALQGLSGESSPEDLLTHLARLRDLIGKLKLSGDERLRLLTLWSEEPASRYTLLAEALGVTEADLKTLEEISGEDLTELTGALRLVEIVEKLGESGLSVEDIDYLLRHRFDPVGKYRPDREGTLVFLTALADEVRTIRSEHTVPEEISEETLREKLSLLLPREVVDRFLAMVKGEAEFTAIAEGVGEGLDPAPFEGIPQVVDISHDPVRGEQRITFRGVVTPAVESDLIGMLSAELGENQLNLLRSLLRDLRTQAERFFSDYLKEEGGAGFLEEGTFETLFAPLPEEPTHAQRELQDRYLLIARALLPRLQERLIRRLVAERVSSLTEAEEQVVESLITDPSLLSLEPGSSLLETILSCAEEGITARFYGSEDTTGEPFTFLLKDADTSLRSTDAPFGSVIFEGYLKVPVSGAYRFYLVSEAEGVEYELRFDHLTEPVLSDSSPEGYTELRAGIPYRFRLSLKRLRGARVRLEVRGETLPRGSLTRLSLYPADGVERAERALTLLRKVFLLKETLKLSGRELHHFLGGESALGGMPTRAGEITEERIRELFRSLLSLLGYVELRAEMAGGTEDLLSVLEADPEKRAERVAVLTRRAPETVVATLQVLFGSPSFGSWEELHRLWEALKIVERFGVSPDTFEGWVRIVSPDIPNEERHSIAQEVRQSVKALFERDEWLQMVQPVSDRLRQKKRDALTAYVMHELGLESMEELYGYFLIDPGMEPVVRTSRIRLAISSVQLFVQRCLLNLEKDVSPSAIDTRQWEWMKRYRVWEANRKIFLWPENWLEPEFRDDKTHLFSELESALLEGDVSEELVEDAFLNYLRKLDELARLDIVASHIEYREDPEDNVLHVFGRTYSKPHRYFYRRYAHGQWTPWEPVNVEIQGDHLAPVVWQDRLYLFWVTFLEEPVMPGGETPRESADKPITPPPKSIKAQLHWSTHDGGRWSAPETSGFVDIGFADIRSIPYYVKESTNGGEGKVSILLRPPYIIGISAPPSVGNLEIPAGFSVYRYGIVEVIKNKAVADFWNPYPSVLTAKAAPLWEGSEGTKSAPDLIVYLYRGTKSSNTILKPAGEYSLLLPNNAFISEEDSLERPFFYQDRLHTFFVEPELRVRSIVDWNGWLELPEGLDLLTPEEGMGELVRANLPAREVAALEAEGPISPHFAALYRVRAEKDWLTDSGSVLVFNGTPVGDRGAVKGEVVSPSAVILEL